jgi:uncharacterized protein (DUF58 family)
VDRHELLRKITTFPLVAEGLSEDLLSGDFRSIFKGQGIEFDEVRHYERGDDVRSIDWNVSARFGTPYVKMYREERELTVCLILDCSASMRSGGGIGELREWGDRDAVSRFDQGVLAAALTAFSAERAGQRVGAVFFGRDITGVFSPRRGRSHIMTIISAALRDRPAGKGSGLGAALAGTGRLLKRRSLVVIISDFLCVNWERELEDLRRKHDVLAIGITDPMDFHLPDMGLLHMRDDETGIRLHAPTAFSSFRSAWSEWHQERRSLWKAICRRAGIAGVELSTAEDAALVLTHFFRGRRRL